jgi:diguanylate cyclase (GGDEF)-like protein
MQNSTASLRPVEPADAQIVDLQAQVAQLQEQVATLKAERTRLWWAVGHDELTGLPNRRLFHDLAPRLLDADDHEQFAAVVVLDLNDFKPINDRWGHHVGDHVLRTCARRLAIVAAGHLVARLGGDEFAAVLTYPFPTGRPTWWRPTVDALVAALAEPIPMGVRRLTVNASVGVALAEPTAPIGELLRRADEAMYLAKGSGQDPAVRVWQPTGDHKPKQPGDQPNPQSGHLRQTAVQDAAGERAGPEVVPPAGNDTAPPTTHPSQRDPAHVAPANTYRPNDRVWVYRDGAWRVGVVHSASRLAVTATYRRTSHHGTGVDTMTAQYVLPRGDTDPDLDRRLAPSAT